MDVLVRLRILLMNFSIIGVHFYWISALFLATEVAMKYTLRVN